jgi:O-antigen/teichoic acid export membrane protein
MAMVVIASTAGSLRLESAIPIATAGEAWQMLKASIWSSLAAGIVCAGLLAGLGHSAVSSEPWLGSVLVVYIVWVTAVYSVLTAHSLRSHQYAAVARRNLLQAMGTAGGQLVLSRWLKSALGLTAGLAVGRSLGVGSLLRESQLWGNRHQAAESSMSGALKRYWRFPLVFMPSALLNVLGTQLPILLVARAYGTESAGNLAQAVTFGAIPAALLGTAISSVLLAELAARVRAGELNQRLTYLRVSKALAPLGLGWFLGLVLVAPRFLPVLLGQEWQSSGEYAAALAIGAGLGLVVSPLTVVLLLYERSRLNFGLDILRVVVVGASGIATWSAGYSSVVCVFAMSAAMGLVYLVTWAMGLRIVSRSQGQAA